MVPGGQVRNSQRHPDRRASSSFPPFHTPWKQGGIHAGKYAIENLPSGKGEGMAHDLEQEREVQVYGSNGT